MIQIVLNSGRLIAQNNSVPSKAQTHSGPLEAQKYIVQSFEGLYSGPFFLTHRSSDLLKAQKRPASLKFQFWFFGGAALFLSAVAQKYSGLLNPLRNLHPYVFWSTAGLLNAQSLPSNWMHKITRGF